MNVWVNVALIKAAVAECETGCKDAASDAGSSALASSSGSHSQHSVAHSESNLSSNSSFDGLSSSSRRSKWVWVESEVMSGSAQSLFGRASPYTSGALIKGNTMRGTTAPSNDGILIIRVTDQTSEHHGKVIQISQRHLSAVADSVAERQLQRFILPANAATSNNAVDHLPSDLTQLTHLHEPAVVDCLHRRYELSGWKVYTSSGPILIAINPCRNVSGLYDDNAMRLYWRWGERLANGGPMSPSTSSSSNIIGVSTLEPEKVITAPPPHVFGVADSAYRGMMRSLDFARSGQEEEKEEDTNYVDDIVANQTVLVSGESGAGKTVTTKFIMQYLAALSKKVDSDQITRGGRGVTEKSCIEQRVLQSNAILEAFGNARTLRNDNSSRFGKFIELRFSQRGRLLGAAIDTYLLEKARIVGHTCGEQTYHIFYEILAKGSLTAAERKQFLINNLTPTDFAITTSDGGRDKSKLMHNGYDDHAHMFGEVRTAMNTMGFSHTEQVGIFQAVCGLLHLSNLTLPDAFEESNDGEECVLSMQCASLDPALHLLGVSYQALNTAVTTVQFKAVDELVKKNLTPSQAIRAVQALIKGLYSSIFSLLVDRINSCIVGSSVDEVHVEGGAFIGVLDIFGFESFEKNSFEQLCINYCNESLQQQFNRFVFKLEQQEYMREGIRWDMIEFEDNQDILDLIEKKHGGILSCLDEQCKLGVRCTDRTFVSAVYKMCLTTNKRFSADKKQQSQGKFCIHHYAGVVEYDTNGFMEKNKDEIPMEASELFSKSSCVLIQNVADVISSKLSRGQEEQKRKALKSSISRVSVGGQFSSQLLLLRRRIDGTHPHYIRCLKPNDQLQPDRFDRNIVVDQLRCGGILEAIRVSRAGFPHRYTFDHFVSRFGMLLTSLSATNDTKVLRPKTVGRLNIDGRATALEKRKVAAPKKQRKDSMKSSEALVKVIAQWIMTGKESKTGDAHKEETSSNTTTSRSFWNSQSPTPPCRGKMNIHKPLDTSEAGIQLGATKVFLLQDTFDCIERVRGQVLTHNATRISALVRMFLARQVYLKLLLSYQESFKRRSLGGEGYNERLPETKSADSILCRIDVNMDAFVSRSPRHRGSSFASFEQPPEYDWISIGHGRFVKRDSATQKLDQDNRDL
jgi:myosin-5